MNPTDMIYRGLIQLVMDLTMLIDSGQHDHVTLGDTREHIRSGDILQWLHSLDRKRIDIRLFGSDGPYPLAAREWLEGLGRQLNAYIVKDDFGIEKRGLCMLLTFTVDQLRMEVNRIVDAADKKVRETEGPPPQPHMH